MKRKQHGGARAGSGRKAKAGAARTIPIPVKIAPYELDGLRERAVAAGLTLAAYVRSALGLGQA